MNTKRPAPSGTIGRAGGTPAGRGSEPICCNYVNRRSGRAACRPRNSACWPGGRPRAFTAPAARCCGCWRWGRRRGCAAPRGEPLAAMIELPLTAGVEAAGALRQFLGPAWTGPGRFAGAAGGGQGPAARAAGRGLDPGLPPRRGGPGLGGAGGHPRGRRTAACVLRSRAGAAGGPAAQRPCALLAVCPCAGAPPGGTGLGAPGRPAPSGGPLGAGLAAVASETTAVGTSLGLCPL